MAPESSCYTSFPSQEIESGDDAFDMQDAVCFHRELTDHSPSITPGHEVQDILKKCRT